MRNDDFIGDMVAAASQNIQAKKYWMNKLSGQLGKSTFPFDYRKEKLKKQKEMESITFRWEGEPFLKLMELSNKIDYSLHMILVGLITVLLEKYTSNDDIMVGAPIYKQEISGKFINTILPIRNKIYEEMTFKELILQIRETVIEAAQNQNYPVETLLYDLDMELTEDEFPLFDIVVLLENIHDKTYIRHIHTNLIFSFNRENEAVTGVIEYNSLRYEKTTMERIVSHLLYALQEILYNVKVKISAINLLTRRERNQLLYDFNNTKRDYPGDQTIGQLFEKQVENIPDHIVIVFDDKQWSYRVLNKSANQLARVLLAKGLNLDSIVGVMLEKSVDMVIVILGILKAGSVYLTIDPAYPETRKLFMMKDSNISLLITRKEMMNGFSSSLFEFVCWDGNRDAIFQQSTENLPVRATPNSPAYIIYTSGSTGLPKGVLIEHTSVANLKTWQSYAFGIGEGSRVLQFFSYSFDGAVGETYMAVLNGAALIMLGLEDLSPENLVKALNRHKINLAVLVPSMIKRMDPGQLTNKNLTVVSVGEACSIDLVREWSPKCRFVNGYGPTETTVYSHIWKAGGEDITRYNSVPIGFPISNYKSYILDPHGNPVPWGVTGEIYISGVGVARGYMNRPEITAERFIFNKFNRKDGEFVEKGSLVMESAKQEITEFKRQHANGNFRRNDLKMRSTRMISRKEIMELVKGLEPDLVDKTDLFVDEYCDGPILLNSFFRYLYEGLENSYFSCGMNKYILGRLLGVEEFQGLSGVDFGFGNAEILQTLTDAGALMTGFDFNPFFIHRARKKNLDVRMLRIDAPLEKFKKECAIEEGSRDFAISTLVLDRIEIPRNLIKNLLWVIKPGGGFAIQTLLPIVPIDDGDVEERLVYTMDENRLAPGRNAEEDKRSLLSQLYELGACEFHIYHFPYVVCSNDGIQNYNVWSFSGIKTVGNNPGGPDRYYLRNYKTGDLGCYLPDGNIKFLGRIDHQLKIRGFRIELEEIEKQLLQHESVKEAVVIPIENEEKDKYLAAYYVEPSDKNTVKGQTNRVNELRRFLKMNLPDYMIPSYFVKLERIPLTASEKVDRNSLPLPEIIAGDEYTAPRNKLEEKLAVIWAEVLGIEKDIVGIDANFFEFGGHSLSATKMVMKIHEELNVKLSMAEIFRIPTIRELSEYLKGAAKELFMSIKPGEKKEYYALSSVQLRLYILHQMGPANISYNIPGAFELEGAVSMEKFKETFKKLIKRHESFRTSFALIGGKPVQEIQDEVEFEIKWYCAGCKQEHLENFVLPFDLSKAPLLRVGLAELDKDRYILMFDMHHIISDALSMYIISKEFMSLYGGEELPPLRIQYNDFSEWQNNQKEKEEMKKQEAYWLKGFDAGITIVNLPTDYVRPLIQSFEGAKLSFEIGDEETRALKELALREDATLYMVLLSLFSIFLAWISSQEDIVMGTPEAGRRHVDLDHIIGMFVNTLVVKSYPAAEKTYKGFLSEMRAKILEIFENQDYQFEDLVDKVAEKRDTGRNPLFDVEFRLDMEMPELVMPGLKLKSYIFENRISKFDLSLQVVEMEDRLAFGFEYCTKIFKKATIERFIVYFKKIISIATKEPGIKLSEIEIISEEEKNRILNDFNKTEAEYPEDTTIHRLFEKQVERTPDHVALVGPKLQNTNHKLQTNSKLQITNNKQSGALRADVNAFGEAGLRAESQELRAVTYKELNEKSNRLALVLQTKDVGPDTIVGIMVERSVEMIVGILAILKSGGAYLPIDPEYPKDRIDYMLKDSRSTILLTENELSNFPSSPSASAVSSVAKNPLPATSNCKPATESRQPAASLAYIIYTSGSTGRPKGTMIEHRNIVRLMMNDKFQFDFSQRDIWTMFHSFCFDFSVWEMYGSLLYGGKLVVITKMTTRDLGRYLDILKKECVTVLNQTPSAFYNLSNLELNRAGSELSIRYVIFGGEALALSRLKEWKSKYPGAKLINMYGITETTVHVTFREIVDSDIDSNISNIGKPIPTLSTYVMDKNLKLLPIGISGELVVGGEGVGRGYLNRPELSREKFVEDPYRAGERLYKSGDLVKLLSMGDLQYLGRIDYQVKIRGYRIELGEIENCLLKASGVKEVVVLTGKEDGGDKYICAYIVSDREYGISELRELLLKELPDYMIPSYFVKMEKIPLTANGKIDRKSLPKPELKTGKSYTAPRNEIEKKLVKLWSEVLGRDALHKSQLQTSIGIDDDFFELGGHSLKATILVSRIHKELKVNMPLTEIFKTSHIRGLAAFIKNAETQRFFSIEAVEKKEYYILFSSQRRLFVLQQMDENGIAYNMPSVWQLEGNIDVEKFEVVFQQLIRRHESMRTSFHMVNDEPVQIIHEDTNFKIEVLTAEDAEITEGKEKNYKLQIQRCCGNGKIGEWENGMAPSEQILNASGNQYPRNQELRTKSFIKDFIRPFDLSKAPLFRVELIEQEEQKHILMIDMHHIITDGVSMDLFVRETMSLYSGEKLPPLRLRYRDYSEWQTSDRQKRAIKEQEEYWLKRYFDKVPVMDLSFDYSRPAIQSFEGNRLSFELPDESTRALKQLALDTGKTLYMVLLAIYCIFLSKLSGQEDIVVGTPIAARRHSDLEGIIGMFVNTLALRNYLNSEQTVLDFLAEVKESTLQAFENQEYQFEDLVERVSVNRDTSRNPLFDSMFALENMDEQANEIPMTGIPQLRIKPYEIEYHTAKFDLNLTCFETGEKLLFSLEYCKKLFKKDTIKRFIIYFQQILAAVLKDRNKKISQIEIITAEEKRRILYDFNDTAEAYPKDKTLHQLFEEQVERTPDHVALLGPKLQNTKYKLQTNSKLQIKNKKIQSHMAQQDTERCYITITYNELNMKSGRLAHMLIEKGIQPDNIVGINVKRSVEMIIGILGILKAGASYLPIDPDYPEERINYMLTDSNANLLVTTSNLFENRKRGSWEIREIFLDAGNRFSCYVPGNSPLERGALEGRGVPKPAVGRPQPTASSSNLAYIIYTSGSTGKPKGVLVEHQSTVNILTALQAMYPLKRFDTYLLKTSYLFDVSVTELLGWFWEGGRLVLLEKGDEKDPARIMAIIEREGITHINFVPSMFNVFVDHLYTGNVKKLSSLKYIFLAGEVLLPGLVGKFRQFNTPIQLENIYGPTEGTIYSSLYSLSTWGGGIVPIGGPMPNVKLYIMDINNHYQPIGVPGELYISGDGLARGYLNNPELTAQKFLNKLYKTGDLARWLVDGNIEFLGRMDHQIKIRGFRIEPGEIENRLLTHDNIKEAVVLVKNDETGDKYLCAYIVSHREQLASELREFLLRYLPDYMVPSYFMPIEKIPLTPGGKIDRKALPEPGIEIDNSYINPRNRIERKLVRIWSDLLGMEKEKISIDANFFALGGHSLKATVLISKIHKEFNMNVSMAQVFKAPTIRGIGGYLKGKTEDKYAFIEAVEDKEYYKVSSMQRRLFFLQQIDPGNRSYNIPGVNILEGNVDKELLEKVFCMLITRHENYRTSFQLVDGELVQRIFKRVDFELKYYEAEENSKEVENIIKLFNSPYDLDNVPLLRAGLIKAAAEKYLLVINFHHIIFDGVSMGILVKEFMALYRGEELPALKLQYKDFAEWQIREARKKWIKKQEEFWLKEFAGELPLLDLPADYKRPSIKNFEGGHVNFMLDKEETQALNSIALSEEATLYMVLLAIYNVFLFKMTRQEDIIVGTSIAGRRHENLWNIIGMFVDALALRNYPQKDKIFIRFLGEVKKRTLEAFENQDLFFEDLVEKVVVTRDPGRNPLFDTMFVFNNEDAQPIEIPGLILIPYQYELQAAQLDLKLRCSQAGDNIYLNFEYSTGLFKKETIDIYVKNFKHIVSRVIEEKNIKLENINISYGLSSSKKDIPEMDFGF